MHVETSGRRPWTGRGAKAMSFVELVDRWLTDAVAIN